MADARIREFGAGMREEVNWSPGQLVSWPDGKEVNWSTGGSVSWPDTEFGGLPLRPIYQLASRPVGLP